MAPQTSVSPADLVALLCSTIARACHLEPSSLSVETRLLDLGLDSLTFISVLTQIEAAFGLELSTDETLVLLEAAGIGELASGLAAAIASRGGVDTSP